MTANHPQPAPSRTRLLVVEDELATLFALREFFALAGYDVDCASSPYEALLLLDRSGYEAVITDLHLTPGRRGEGLGIAANARQQNGRACVVMLTAYGTEATEVNAHECGVNLYQTKPVDLRRLTAEIQRVLDFDGDPHACPRRRAPRAGGRRHVDV